MKSVVRMKMMIMACFMIGALSINTSKAQGGVSLQVFYDELQPHGTWMQHANYGYVWMPRVDRSFVPYGTSGYWVNTEFGNTWVSDYAWGWAPFHYGRWFYDDFHGWMWVPDTVWGPAWVAWRSGGGYYGWAPLMPGYGINVSHNYYNHIPNYYWNFVPYRYITYRHVYNHCAPRTRVVNIIHNTTIVTHNHTNHRRHTFFTGPSRSDMERTTGGRVPVYKVNDRSRPGRSDIDRTSVSFYKPEIDNSRDARINSVPARFMKEDRNGNKEMVDARRGATPSEFQRNRSGSDNIYNYQRSDGNRNEANKFESKDFNTMQRTQQMEREKQNQSFENFKQDRERMNRDQNLNQRLTKPVEKQNENRSGQNFQQQRESFNKTAPNINNSNQRKASDQPYQRLHQQQKQNNFQQERAVVKPNKSSTIQPERSQQLQRGSSDRSSQPTRSTGGGSRQNSQRER